MRLETPKGILTYSSDTGPEPDLARFARGSDLALFEATYQESFLGAPVHISATEAAQRAVRAEAGRLALTHFWPPLDPRISLEEGRAAAPGLPVVNAGREDPRIGEAERSTTSKSARREMQP
jgi:ribonuclease BN (tRNA processing enzyme)